MQSHPVERILRLNEVKTRTGKKRSTIYADMKEGLFPCSIKLGPRSVGWLESEIDAWIKGRIRTTRKGTNPKIPSNS